MAGIQDYRAECHEVRGFGAERWFLCVLRTLSLSLSGGCVCNTCVVGMVQVPGGRGVGGLSHSTSCSSPTFFLLCGGRSLDQHGRLPRRAVLRYDVPISMFGFGA